MPRLAILSTHPIQYYAPLFRELHAGGELDIHVFYGWEGMAGKASVDRGFGREVQWDIPLLDGYPHTFLTNTSRDPGTHHFKGIDSPEVTDRIAEWHPDALLVFGWNYHSHLKALRYFSGQIPVLFRGDSTLIGEQYGLRLMMRRVFLRWIYRNVDTALFVGQRNREYFKAHGLTDRQLVWSPHAIENVRFEAEPESRDAEARQWRKELGISDSAFVFLFAGKLEDNKQPSILLDAFLSLNYPDAHLVFVGTGPLESKLVKAAGSYSQVHFLGFQNQSRMPTVYRLGEVYVLPSQNETWGLAVNEAMACGRPVIVSDRVGCAPDLVIEEETGWAFSAGDPLALNHVLQKALDDRDRTRTMGDKARKVISGWSIEEGARRIVLAVAGVLKK